MNDLKRQPWWKWSVAITPAAATLLGFASGSAIGALVAFPWLDRLSLIMWLGLVFMGGVQGYIFWVVNDRARSERFQRMHSQVAAIAVAVLLLAFPGFWWQMWRDSSALAICLVGAICGLSMFMVGAGWGLVHLVSYLRTLLRSHTKASLTCSAGGVWDRELDELFLAGKRDTRSPGQPSIAQPPVASRRLAASAPASEPSGGSRMRKRRILIIPGSEASANCENHERWISPFTPPPSPRPEEGKSKPKARLATYYRVMTCSIAAVALARNQSQIFSGGDIPSNERRPS